jgi:hypothetical protein
MVVDAATAAKRVGRAVDMHLATEIRDIQVGEQIGQGPRPAVDVAVHRAAQRQIVA